MVHLDKFGLFVHAFGHQPSAITACKDRMTGETMTITKAVTQFVPFLSDNRAGDRLMEEVNAIEEEELEPTEVP